MSSRSHPVRQTLDYAAMGEVPREDDLDRLKLPAQLRRRVSDHARSIVALKLEGQNSEARRRAADVAGEIIDSLPEEMQTADYLRREPETPESYDPIALAERVTRW